jgi:hypothetical protein
MLSGISRGEKLSGDSIPSRIRHRGQLSIAAACIAL